ncbi:type I restriction-modification enzyme R subunit C-terminal domain-containing protein [Methylobacterium sp. A52T]
MIGEIRNLHKLRQGKPLAANDLAELEPMLLKAGIGDTQVIERVRATSSGFGGFVRSLIGLERQAVQAALSEFRVGGSASAEQIEFIGLVVDHLTERGTMEPALLYERRFIDVAPQGPGQVFDQRQADRLIEKIRNSNQTEAA